MFVPYSSLGAGVSLNCSIYYTFRDELPRISIPRTWVNKSLLLGRSDALPDQVRSLLLALDQYGVRAQRYSVSPNFDQTFLVNTAPVRKRTDLYMVYYRVSSEVIRATIREESLLGFRLFLWRAAQKISTSEVNAVWTHYSHEHVSVRVVHDVSLGILTERVANLIIIDAPVLPG